MAEVAEGQGELFLESSLLDEPSRCSRAAVRSLLSTFRSGMQGTPRPSRYNAAGLAIRVAALCLCHTNPAAFCACFPLRGKEQDVGDGYLN